MGEAHERLSTAAGSRQCVRCIAERPQPACIRWLGARACEGLEGIGEVVAGGCGQVVHDVLRHRRREGGATRGGARGLGVARGVASEHAEDERPQRIHIRLVASSTVVVHPVQGALTKGWGGVRGGP